MIISLIYRRDRLQIDLAFMAVHRRLPQILQPQILQPQISPYREMSGAEMSTAVLDDFYDKYVLRHLLTIVCDRLIEGNESRIMAVRSEFKP